MRDESSARRVPLRLVVIEDQALFRQLTVEVVRSDPRFTVVGEAADGREGWELCLRTRPDLVILDLNIPEPDGLALCGRLREELPDARVLAVTSYTDALTLTRLQDLGVAGYVEKDQPLETLRQALEALAGGGRSTPASWPRPGGGSRATRTPLPRCSAAGSRKYSRSSQPGCAAARSRSGSG